MAALTECFSARHRGDWNCHRRGQPGDFLSIWRYKAPVPALPSRCNVCRRRSSMTVDSPQAFGISGLPQGRWTACAGHRRRRGSGRQGAAPLRDAGRHRPLCRGDGKPVTGADLISGLGGRWIPRAVQAEDFGGAALAFVATGNDRGKRPRNPLSQFARAAGVSVNVVDRPELCDFFTPAIVNRAPLAVAVCNRRRRPGARPPCPGADRGAAVAADRRPCRARRAAARAECPAAHLPPPLNGAGSGHGFSTGARGGDKFFQDASASRA